MSRRNLTRRSLLKKAGLLTAGVAAAPFMGPWRYNRVYGAASDKPIVIGLTSDASGQYANSGASDRRGMQLAISEFNKKGGVLGRKVETIHIDTETTPATGSRVAERLITRHECAFLIGAVSSGVANAISQVAQKYGTVYLNTNSSSPTESGKNCHRVKFVWDGNGTNFAQAAVKNAISAYGKKWLLMTNDYVWGHNTSKATRGLVGQFGGEIIDEILVPQGTRDFSAMLLKVQQAAPRWWRRLWAATTRRPCASRSPSSDWARRWPGSTTSRTGPTCTACRSRTCSACSAPPGTGSWTCRVSRTS